jgi:hypothetical protein
VAGLYLYNADLGETRTAGYLTLISVGVAGLLGLSQLEADTTTILELMLGVLGGIFLLGYVTFIRLIERRIRSVEYLRAINRIHAYFAQKDPELAEYFSWPPHDDVPGYGGRVSDVTGLRDIIAILNSIFFGVMIGVLGHLLQPEPREVMPLVVLLGIASGIALLVAQFWIEHRTLNRAERLGRRRARFPRDGAGG